MSASVVSAPVARVPGRGVAVVLAGTAVNLCLGILYAWSIWKARLTPKGVPAGTALDGLDTGWVTLTDAQATWAYAVCGVVFALTMIPGGRLQDRFGPRRTAFAAGLCLAAGCALAGWMQSFLGLVLGFGVLGGLGMGFGYAAATPAAVKWVGPHRRGLVVGLVVGGFGGAAIYISPLATYLIQTLGITGSFLALGGLFGAVILLAGCWLVAPPPGYQPPPPPATWSARRVTATDVPTRALLRTGQFYALVGLFAVAAQAGLLVIANAAPILSETARELPWLASNGWILAAFGGVVNAAGRIGTGLYSDRIGRLPAYMLNAAVAAVCLALAPWVIETRNVPLLFVVVGIAFWQYGGTLSLMPALTADLFGQKHLGLNYGCVFFGWGLAFLGPLAAAELRAATGLSALPYYLSGGLLLGAVAGAGLLAFRTRLR